MKDKLTYDCHCHILPGLDDGAADLEESLDLCRWFVAHGIAEVVCTTHSTRRYPNTAETVEAAVAALRAELDRQGIALRLIPRSNTASCPRPGLRSGSCPGRATISLWNFPCGIPKRWRRWCRKRKSGAW